MPLMCYCDEGGYEPGDVVYYTPSDYTPAPAKGRRHRCWSCGELIRHGAMAVRFERYKVPQYDIECDIYGEDGEVPRAPKWLCETCGDLWFSLTDHPSDGGLGFCGIRIGENLKNLLHEWFPRLTKT